MQRNTLLIVSALWAAAMLPAYAADATLYRLDTREGTLEAYATGAFKHEPLYMVYTSEPYVVDACGGIYGLEEDRYGDRVIGDAIATVPAATEVVVAQSNGRSGTGLMADGQLVKLDFSKFRWERAPDWGFVYAIDGGDIPEAKVFLPADNAGAPVFIDDKGRMVYVALSGASFDHLRRIKGAEGFKDVVNGIRLSFVNKERQKTDFVLTTNADGKARVTYLEFDNEDNVSGRTEDFPGDFSGTRLWLGPGGGTDTPHMYRVTEEGVIHRVYFPSGESQVLGDAKVYGKVISQTSSHLFFVSIDDAEFADCPAPEPEVKEETGPKYSGEAAKAVALDEELQRLYAEYEDDFEAIVDSHEMPEDVHKMDNAALTTAFGPILDELDAFELNVVNEVRATYDALRAYGDEEWKIREALQKLTDGEYSIGGAYYNFTRELDDYEKYRRNIGANILSDARIKFMIAESQSDADEAARLYLAALPFAEWALKFDPDLEEAQQYLATARERAAKAIADEKRKIAAATWPEGKEDDFQGPGDAEDLLQEVLDLFNEKADRALHEQGARFFAINMREDHWMPGKTNVLGEILEYRLYLTIAQTMPEEPWFARVCDIEVGTLESVKRPPFDYRYWQGCQKMLLEKVKVWDEDRLEESLELIKQKTGLTPGDMPEDALDPLATGVDTGGNDKAQATASNNSNQTKSSAVASTSSDSSASGSADSSSGESDAADEDTGDDAERGGGWGWFVFLLLIAGGAGAAWYWQDRLPKQLSELIGRYLPKR